MSSDTRTVIKLGCCAVTTLIAVVLLGTSFAVLKPTQVGLWYNPTLNKMMYDSGIWENGRHILGPGHAFKVSRRSRRREPRATCHTLNVHAPSMYANSLRLSAGMLVCPPGWEAREQTEGPSSNFQAAVRLTTTNHRTASPLPPPPSLHTHT